MTSKSFYPFDKQFYEITVTEDGVPNQVFHSNVYLEEGPYVRDVTEWQKPRYRPINEIPDDDQMDAFWGHSETYKLVTIKCIETPYKSNTYGTTKIHDYLGLNNISGLSGLGQAFNHAHQIYQISPDNITPDFNQNEK